MTFDEKLQNSRNDSEKSYIQLERRNLLRLRTTLEYVGVYVIIPVFMHDGALDESHIVIEVK